MRARAGLYLLVQQRRTYRAPWALTTTAVYTKLTAEAGWDGATYQHWLAEMLSANLP